MSNPEIHDRLLEISNKLEELSTAFMYNNHIRDERMNALLQGNIDTAAIMLRRTAFYLP